KQGQYEPMPVEEQVAVIYVAVNGYLDDLPVDKVRDFENEFLKYMRTQQAGILESIRTEMEIKPETDAKLKSAIEEFKKGFKMQYGLA
ncbi:MAG: F0F1 ATP synthase subunit alpha, partial [Thermoanaerobacteraceae bacterium]|nr:F0F1 ATP synthase subunit alpha [Thermoanaerobacteraceae bacterium]